MKTKYRLNNLYIYEDRSFTAFLQKQAAKGWMLKKVGMFFFKFKKEKPRDVNFFIDYARPVPSYLQALNEKGYHFIDNQRIINIFYSEVNTDPIAKADIMAGRKKALYHPGIIITSLILGLFMFWLSDLFSLSDYLFISQNHLILYLNDLITYVAWKVIAVFFIWLGIYSGFLRFSYWRESQNKPIPHALFTVIRIFAQIFNTLIVVMGSVLLIVYAYDTPAMFLTFVIFLLLYYVFFFCLNKKIIKIENKTTRMVLTGALLILFVIASQSLPKTLIQENTSAVSNEYHNAASNYQSQSRTLLYEKKSYYGHDHAKNEFDEYIETYHHDIYSCRNQNIASRIFAALVINADHERRVPDWSVIEAITEEKGSFDSLKDVPFYSYEKSAAAFNTYHDSAYDLCYGKNNHYLIIKNHTVLDLQVKDPADLKKLITYYLGQ